MKYFKRLLLPVLLALLGSLKAGAQGATEKNLKYSAFGEFKVFQGATTPRSLILFLSGDSGWTAELDAAARSLVSEGRVVAGLSLPKYRAVIEARKSKCTYPSGDLENVSKFLQAELRFADYQLPVLIGAGEGAAFAYGAFMQAPENTFMSAIGWNFCPRYRAKKPICAGDGMRSQASGKDSSYEILNTDRNLARWIAISPSNDKSCAASAVESFMSGVKESRLIKSASDGKPELVAQVAELLNKAPAQNLQAGSVDSLKNLPIITLEPAKEMKRGPDDYFVVFYSGDGGWAGFDKVISAEYNARSVPVVGLSTLSYFWKPKNADIAAEDLRKIVLFFQQKWRIQKFVLLGYSFGADVLPFMATRLPEAMQKQIAAISLLSSSGYADFEFNFKDWLSSAPSGPSLIPELARLKAKVPVPVQCIYGSDEKKPFCLQLDKKDYVLIKLPGGHRFDGDTPKLVNILQSGVSKSSTP